MRKFDSFRQEACRSTSFTTPAITRSRSASAWKTPRRSHTAAADHNRSLNSASPMPRTSRRSWAISRGISRWSGGKRALTARSTTSARDGWPTHSSCRIAAASITCRANACAPGQRPRMAARTAFARQRTSESLPAAVAARKAGITGQSLSVSSRDAVSRWSKSSLPRRWMSSSTDGGGGSAALRVGNSNPVHAASPVRINRCRQDEAISHLQDNVVGCRNGRPGRNLRHSAVSVDPGCGGAREIVSGGEGEEHVGEVRGAPTVGRALAWGACQSAKKVELAQSDP